MLPRMCDILITDSFEALENEDQSTKHPNIENKEPKSRKRSTQNSKTKHPNIENDAPKTQKLENGAPKSRKQSTQNSKPVCRVFPYEQIRVRDALFRRKSKKGCKTPKRTGPLGRTCSRAIVY